MRGYVYLVHIDGDHYKIGRTSVVGRRLRELSRYSRLTLVHAISTDDAVWLEDQMHSTYYKEERLYDELFKLNSSAVQWFKNILFWGSQNVMVMADGSVLYQDPWVNVPVNLPGTDIWDLRIRTTPAHQDYGRLGQWACPGHTD